jgi:serine/threonine protein phosphatase PrpC
MRYAITTETGERKGKRGGHNEDAVTAVTVDDLHGENDRGGGVFVLADGVGGSEAGDVASYLATTTVASELSKTLTELVTRSPDQVGLGGLGHDGLVKNAETHDIVPSAITHPEIRDRMTDAATTANDRVVEFCKRSQTEEAAATLVVAVYWNGRLHYAWAGDSRLYVVNRANETIRQLTTDHVIYDGEEGPRRRDPVVERLDQAGRVGEYVGGNLHATESEAIHVETGTVDCYRDDVVFLTSDGLLDAYWPGDDDADATRRLDELLERYRTAANERRVREEILNEIVTEDELREVVLGAESLETAVEELCTLANDRGGKDNLSLVLLSDRDAPSTPSNADDRGMVPSVLTPEGDLAIAPSTGSNRADRSKKAYLARPETSVRYAVRDGTEIGRIGGSPTDIEVDREDVSRTHCRFDFDPESGWTVRDDSTNGTYVQRSDDRRPKPVDTRSESNAGDSPSTTGAQTRLTDDSRIFLTSVDDGPEFEFQIL